jgi:sporulation protein YlmC with PRC-barrel domain
MSCVVSAQLELMTTRRSTVKLKHCIAPALAGVLMLSPSVAAQAPTGQPQRPPDQPRVEGPRTEEPRTEARERDQEHAVIRADRLIGQAVRDRADERLGRIDDLALNVADNKIAYAVISRGGLFGIGAEEVAVSWDELRPDMAERVVRAEGQAVQQARRIDTRTAWPTEVGRPGEPAAEQPVGTAGRDDQVREIVGVSRIIGMDVRNQQGERLGQVDDIALQRDGSIAYAVIAHGGFLGMGHNYVAVPWDRLNLDREREQVMLNVTQQQLEGARQFEHGERWPARADWPFGN